MDKISMEIGDFIMLLASVFGSGFVASQLLQSANNEKVGAGISVPDHAPKERESTKEKEILKCLPCGEVHLKHLRRSFYAGNFIHEFECTACGVCRAVTETELRKMEVIRSTAKTGGISISETLRKAEAALAESKRQRTVDSMSEAIRRKLGRKD
jgi:hypothetical protein